MVCNEELEREAAYCYVRVCHWRDTEDYGLCRLYGINCRKSQGELVVEVADVSANGAVVDKLVSLLNRCAVSCIHTKEVVEDFVALL